MWTRFCLLVGLAVVVVAQQCELRVGEETVQKGEEERLVRVANELFARLMKVQREGERNATALHISRFGYGKTHACTRASLTVADTRRSLEQCDDCDI